MTNLFPVDERTSKMSKRSILGRRPKERMMDRTAHEQAKCSQVSSLNMISIQFFQTDEIQESNDISQKGLKH